MRVRVPPRARSHPTGQGATVLTDEGTLVIVGSEGGNRITGGFGRQLRAVLVSPFLRQRLTMFISREHRKSVVIVRPNDARNWTSPRLTHVLS